VYINCFSGAYTKLFTQCNFGTAFHFWQKWHIGSPIEQECCLCQSWINTKIGIQNVP